MSEAPSYVGRFAPSPTGPLHFGSLLSALASFLDARAHRGHWLVRMEDLDPPREQPGAADAILATLEHYHLHWDGPVRYQSQRGEAYQAVLDTLWDRGELFRCRCTRQDLHAMGGIYNGHCRTQAVSATEPHALRLRAPTAAETFTDLFQGPQRQALATEVGDWVLKRKDGLYGYQLAVVVDDIDQGVTHIIRGADLLDSSPRQRYLTRLLGAPPASYGHIPVALNDQGQKLSKQNLAPPLKPEGRSENLWLALTCLGQAPPAELRGAPVATLLAWGAAHWRRGAVPRQPALPAPAAFVSPQSAQ